MSKLFLVTLVLFDRQCSGISIKYIENCLHDVPVLRLSLDLFNSSTMYFLVYKNLFSKSDCKNKCISQYAIL